MVIRRRSLFALLTALTIAFASCVINPQPEPPGDDQTDFGERAGSGGASSDADSGGVPSAGGSGGHVGGFGGSGSGAESTGGDPNACLCDGGCDASDDADAYEDDDADSGDALPDVDPDTVEGGEELDGAPDQDADDIDAAPLDATSE